MKKTLKLIGLVLAVIAIFCSCAKKPAQKNDGMITLDNLPEFSNEPYVAIYDNEPDFSKGDMKSKPFEKYGELDALGRCSQVFACISKELMPTEERGSIGQVKPSGWQTVKYDIVDGKYLYNRCHLIGFQLTGENANKCNLITGTRYMNVEGMLPFENMVADYIKETENRVLYRVTPIFKGVELVARGVQIEAKSIEDDGEGICFNVYVYNNQPGITIDYLNGNSAIESEGIKDGETSDTENSEQTFILNKSSKKFHSPNCSGADSIKAENKEEYKGSREALLKEGYEPCGTCKP